MNSCIAKFSANSDIDGLGIMIAYLLTAWFTVLWAFVALFPHSRRKSGSKSLDPFFRRLCVDPTCSAQRFLASLMDLQVITSMAILIAGFAQYGPSTIYHRTLVHSYWGLAANSFMAARSNILDPACELDQVMLRARRTAILISLCSGITYQIMRMHWVEHHWSDSDSGQCYRYTVPTPAGDIVLTVLIYFFLICAIVYAIQLFFLVISRRSWIKWIQDRLSRWQSTLRDWTTQTAKAAKATISTPCLTLSARFHGILYLFLCPAVALTYALYYVFVWWFIEIFDYGKPYSLFNLCWCLGSIIWDTYNIVILKSYNRDLIEEDDQTMGFGQILPILMLLQPALLAIDISRTKLSKDTRLAVEDDEVQLLGAGGPAKMGPNV